MSIADTDSLPRWALICSYGSQALRLNLNQPPAHAADTAGDGAAAAPPPQQRLRAHAAEWRQAEVSSSVDNGSYNSSCILAGLALLAPGSIWGPLMSRLAWSEFAQRQRRYYHKAEDSYTCKVLRFLPMASKQEIYFRVGWRGTRKKVHLRES